MHDETHLTPEQLLDKLEAIDPYLPDATLVMLGGGCRAEHCHCRELLSKQPEKFIDMMRERALVVEQSLKTAITNVLDSSEAQAASEERLQDSDIDREPIELLVRGSDNIWQEHDAQFEKHAQASKPMGCVFTG